METITPASYKHYTFPSHIARTDLVHTCGDTKAFNRVSEAWVTSRGTVTLRFDGGQVRRFLANTDFSIRDDEGEIVRFGSIEEVCETLGVAALFTVYQRLVVTFPDDELVNLNQTEDETV